MALALYDSKLVRRLRHTAAFIVSLHAIDNASFFLSALYVVIIKIDVVA